MLTDEQVLEIRAKMKALHVYSATFARELNMSRQAVNLILNRKGKSQKVEEYLLKWLNKGD